MEIYYINHKGDKIYLDRNPYMMLTDTDMFNYGWDYETKNNKLYNISRKLIEKKARIVISARTMNEYKKTIEKFYETIDIDPASDSFGRLYFGDYYLHCFIYSSEKPNKYINTKRTVIDISIVSNSNTWTRSIVHNYNYNQQNVDSKGRGYPYEYPYDYSSGGGHTSDLISDDFGYSDAIITIKGYARKPEISIGESVYKLDYNISTNETCFIDTKNKTVKLLKSDGRVMNLFRYRDKNHYLFDKIKPDYNQVYWNGDFDFSVEILSERGEPLWT